MQTVSFYEAERAYEYARSLYIGNGVGVTCTPKDFVCRKVVILLDEEQGYAVQVTFCGGKLNKPLKFPEHLNGVPLRVKFENTGLEV